MTPNTVFHRIKTFGIKEWISLAALVIPAALLAYVWAIAPVVADDLMYTSKPDHYLAEGRNLWAGILAELQFHAMFDNIRLANVVYLVSAYFVSRPLMACIMAVCFSAGIWVFTRVVSGGLHTPMIVCTILFVYTYILQWLIVLSHDYLMNYLPTMLLVAIVLYLFLRIDTLGRGKRKLLYILALVLGLWHESGALPLLLALTVYMFVTRRSTKAQIFVCVFLFLGVALCFCAPGPWVRLAGTYNDVNMPKFQMKFSFAVALLSVPIAAWMYLKDRRKYGRVCQDTALICLCAAGMVGGFILFLVIHISPRTNFCGVMLAACAFILFGHRIFKGRKISRQWWLSIPILAVTITHCAFVAITATDAVNVFRRIEHEFIASGKDYIFCDLGPVRHFPSLWTCKMADSDHLLMHDLFVQEWILIHHRGKQRGLIFFPRELCDVDIEPGEKIPGGNSIYRKGDVLYIPYNDSTAHLLTRRFWWNVDKERVFELNSDTLRTPRGFKIIYLDPHNIGEEIPSRIKE